MSLVLENLDCPHNTSAILRTCDGFGIHNVSLIEAAFSKGHFALNRDVSKGCERYLDISRHANTWAWLERAQQRGGTIVSTEIGAPEVSNVDWR